MKTLDVILCFGILTIFVFTGCLTWLSTRYYYRSYSIGEELVATVGGEMLSWSYGVKNNKTGAKEGTKKELIYCGKVNGAILVKYREYNEGPEYTLARQAFYLDVSYEVSPPSTISFQDLTIRVDSVDHNKILFAVIDGPRIAETVDNSGKIGLFFDAGGTILEIAYDMPAETSGIKVGDRILKIDGRAIPVGDHDGIMWQLSGKPNTVVEVEVRRGDSNLVFRVPRKRYKVLETAP